MSGKSYSCDSCGRQYKNSKSLRTHRYSYHRSQIDTRNKDKVHSSPNDSVSLNYDYGYDYATKNKLPAAKEFTTDDPGYDYLQDKVTDIAIDSVLMKSDLNILKSTVDELDRLVRNMSEEMKSNDSVSKCNKTHFVRYEDSILPSNELRVLKLRVESNKNDIRDIQDTMDNTVDKNIGQDIDVDLNELAAEDLIDSMIEIRNSFVENDIDEVTADISKFRNVLKLILKTVNLSKLNEEEIQLLNEISNASKLTAKSMIHEHFSHLVNMFDRIKTDLDELFEPSDGESNDSEEQEIESENDEQESDIDGNNSMTDQSESETASDKEEIQYSSDSNISEIDQSESESTLDNHSISQSEDQSD